MSGGRCGVLLRAVVAALLVLASGAQARAAELSVQIDGPDGAGVSNAVAVLEPLDRTPPGAAPGAQAIMDQRGLRYVPQVLVVQAGTRVLFPNSDQVRHHVYSFSPPKTFELRLYPNTQVPSETFDRPGVEVLGCNIHDWMLGYIYITDTPYFASTDARGRARIGHLPPGDYRLVVWHPFLKSIDPGAQRPISVLPGTQATERYTMTLEPPEQSNRPPPELNIADPGPRHVD